MKTYLTFGILVLYALLGINVVNLSAEENWTRKADMPTQRSYFSTCVVNGKIYAIGGEIDGFGELAVSTVEMYDPKTDTWTQKADMPTSRITSTCVVDGKIYAIGGEKTHKRRIGPGWGHDLIDLSTVEMYDPATDTWTQKSDMPTPRSASTCVVDGKIYAIGGTAANRKQWRLDTVEVYDPATDTWTKGKKMNHVRSGAAISVVDRKIYVMGGTGWPQIPFHPGPFLSSMEVYNPKTNQWREIGDMPAAKSGHTASVINGKIYVIGGFFRAYKKRRVGAISESRSLAKYLHTPERNLCYNNVSSIIKLNAVHTFGVALVFTFVQPNQYDEPISYVEETQTIKRSWQMKEILYRKVFDEIHTTFFSPLSNIYLFKCLQHLGTSPKNP